MSFRFFLIAILVAQLLLIYYLIYALSLSNF